MTLPDRAACLRLDADDPLAAARDRFDLPGDVLYLDGNSLGALPRHVPGRVADVVSREWGRDLIRSWNKAKWIEAPARVGDRVAGLIGARPGEVVAADSTSVNLFKLLAGALRQRPGRRVIVSEQDNFPTDLYIMQGLIETLGDGHELRYADPANVAAALDDDVAVVALTHVNYKTGRVHDMAAVTAAAHRVGALVLWDLAHSAGALAVDLAGAEADLAVGCGYKYLNGGPGAPAFLYVRRDLQAAFRQPLSGWMGHARPFEFERDYQPAPGIRHALCGTPAVISLIALEAALEVFDGVDLQDIRRKSMALGDLFITLVEDRAAGHGLTLRSPREAALRGSQVSFGHGQGYAIMQALIARGVIGDFRAPDLLRFGFAPLYIRYVDVWDAVEVLRDVLEHDTWRDDAFQHRAAVT